MMMPGMWQLIAKPKRNDVLMHDNDDMCNDDVYGDLRFCYDTLTPHLAYVAGAEAHSAKM